MTHDFRGVVEVFLLMNGLNPLMILASRVTLVSDRFPYVRTFVYSYIRTCMS